jgi:hypothetical protein
MDQWLGLAVVFATLLGPILAVIVTRWIDSNRAEKSRQLEIFRALMRTRRAPLLPDHVNALNLVEIEFHGVSAVLTAYNDLMQFVNTPAPADEQWPARHRSYLTKLLSAMAKHLGYKIEQLAVLEGGYYPTGWGTADEQQLALRLGFIELLSGKRSLPTTSAAISAPRNSAFEELADRLTPSTPPKPPG